VIGALGTLANIEEARTAYAVSREARGMPVRQETLEAVFSPAGIWASVGFVLQLLGISAMGVWKKRRWFQLDEVEVEA
jgi:hypothetical protein